MTTQIILLTIRWYQPHLHHKGILKWRQVTGQTNSNIHLFTGDIMGNRQNVASHVNEDWTPVNDFMFYFAAVITLLLVETGWYYQLYLYFPDSGLSPVPDITQSEVFQFLQLLFRWDMTTWKTIGHLLNISFHLFMAKQWDLTRFLPILRFIHFSNNDNAFNSNDPN